MFISRVQVGCLVVHCAALSVVNFSVVQHHRCWEAASGLPASAPAWSLIRHRAESLGSRGPTRNRNPAAAGPDSPAAGVICASTV